jgi:hypothetical protein
MYDPRPSGGIVAHPAHFRVVLYEPIGERWFGFQLLCNSVHEESGRLFENEEVWFLIEHAWYAHVHQG